MLGLGAEMRHGSVASEPAGVSAAEEAGGGDATKRDLSHASLPHTRTNSKRVKPRACISQAGDDDHKLSLAGCARYCSWR
jgi:hypothetical protein